jgi:hypothetical protein
VRDSPGSMILLGRGRNSWFAGALLSVLLLVPLPALAQRGALVQPRNLGELVAQSTTIVRGAIISARVEPHPDLNNLSTVVITLRVRETLKGEAGETLTFRQFIWDVRDKYDAAGYRKGEDVLLLLNPVTSYGLTSPAGLDQGRFRISRDALGREVAANGRRNAGLFDRLPQQLKSKRLNLPPQLAALANQSAPGPIELVMLRELIHSLAASRH